MYRYKPKLEVGYKSSIFPLGHSPIAFLYYLFCSSCSWIRRFHSSDLTSRAKFIRMAGGSGSMFIGGPRSAWDKQFVWPREGRKGKTPRSWWGGLMSIMTNTGPDIFITRKNDTTPIKPDHWGNWQVRFLAALNIR